jgi:hypothetical protein
MSANWEPIEKPPRRAYQRDPEPGIRWEIHASFSPHIIIIPAKARIQELCSTANFDVLGAHLREHGNVSADPLVSRWRLKFYLADQR